MRLGRAVVIRHDPLLDDPAIFRFGANGWRRARRARRTRWRRNKALQARIRSEEFVELRAARLAKTTKCLDCGGANRDAGTLRQRRRKIERLVRRERRKRCEGRL